MGTEQRGPVPGSGASTLIDTLVDLPSTSEMLAAMTVFTYRQPITTVVNAHSDGDHYFGNQLVVGDGVQIIASQAAAELMTQEAVDEIAALSGLPGAAGEFARKIFSPFGFDAIVLTGPTQTFSGEHPRSHANQDVANGHIGTHTSGHI